jgi:hypothetical protein
VDISAKRNGSGSVVTNPTAVISKLSRGVVTFDMFAAVRVGASVDGATINVIYAAAVCFVLDHTLVVNLPAIGCRISEVVNCSKVRELIMIYLLGGCIELRGRPQDERGQWRSKSRIQMLLEELLF